MDGESSYESDISESWSLIDVNDNDELLSVTETPSELEKTPAAELKNVKSRKRSDLELKDFVEKCKEIYKTDFGPLNGSDCNSSFVNEGFVSCSNKEIEGIHFPSNRSGEDDGPNDSDVESIEILDMDGNYRDSEMDRLDTVLDSHDSQTYQSDDEESLGESISNESRNNSSTVIRRKRKKIVKNLQDPVNSINSEDRSVGKCDSKTCLNEAKTNNGESSKEFCNGNSQLIFKHYKNNVATTILSLSVGVIFAVVACIAIGHFLGVQDAGETAGELVETLKKLQVENAALQSRLFHLNRALLNRETNSKSGLPPNKAPCQEAQKVGASGTPETDLNLAALSEIRSSLTSIEWLSKLQNLVRNDNKANENAIDFNGFGKYIHDQLNFLRNKKEGGIRLLEDADRKISKVLQKIVTRLSTSQENIENLYHRLINIKNKLNQKLNKILPDRPQEMGEEKPKFEKRVPVTELDLQSIRWDSDEKVAENSLRENPGSVVVYQFPQPEEYYQVEFRSLENIKGNIFGTTNSSEALKEGLYEKVEKKDKKSYRCESVKNKHKRQKKNKSKEKEAEGETKEKREKCAKSKSAVRQTEKEKEKRKKRKVFASELAKDAFGMNFNKLADSQRKKHSKVGAEVLKLKPKFKKIKKSKLKKSLLSKVKKNGHGKKKHDRLCAMHQCFNSTGFWVFKWAHGRDEFRRHQALGDWQFERAKGREELRDEEYGVFNWQFRRALGRESNRHVGRWHYGKRIRFNGKEFFTTGFREFEKYQNCI